MNKFISILFLSVIFCVFEVRCWRKFHLGQKVGGLPPPEGPDVGDDEIEDKYISQFLHNYHLLLSSRVWQRYFVNDEYFNTTNKNKVFLIIGGAQEASKKWMKHGPWAEAAKEHGALLFMLEHRFYGKSRGFSTHTTENLRFSTTHQALEDAARFISEMNKEYDLPSDVKWYVFGGSYAGTLAAFLRVRNPHLVAGAISISGPLQAKLDFSEYLQVVVDDLASHSQNCVDSIQKAFQQLDELIDTENSAEIDSLFNTCDSFKDSFNNTKDIGNFYQILSEEFASVAQFQNVQGIWNITTDDLCDIMVDGSMGSEIQRLSRVNSLILRETEEECLDYKYDKMIAEYRNITVTDTGNMRQWSQHTCMNFGWYPTSNQTTQVFGNKFPVSFFIDFCHDVHGYSETVLNTGIFTINNRYGGANIQGTNIIFVHGTRDPWYPLGITETKDDSSPAIFINGTGHCAALYSESESDSEELKAARKQIFNTLRTWINEEDSDSNDSNTCNSKTSASMKALSISLLVVAVILVVVVIIIWRKMRQIESNKERVSVYSQASTLPQKSQLY